MIGINEDHVIVLQVKMTDVVQDHEALRGVFFEAFKKRDHSNPENAPEEYDIWVKEYEEVSKKWLTFFRRYLLIYFLELRLYFDRNWQYANIGSGKGT